jgi:hypothetical protein
MSLGRGSSKAALFFLLALGLASPAVGQVTTGTVVGTVQDSTGGVLPGATVVLVSDTRGTKMPAVITNGQGNFTVPNVAPDRYSVEVSMPSFKTASRAGVPVSGGDRVTVPTFQLQVGGTSEIITVTDSVPLIQAQSGERSYTVTAEQVMNLPFQDRGFLALAALAPGMDGGNRLGGGGFNNVMMDGVSTMDTGNNAAVLNLNTEAIAEVKVLTSGYQAEYGRASGAQITAVTKSGTNRFHGSVYDVERNSDWNSNSWQNKLNGQPKTTSKEKDFGYTIGGPVGKPGSDNKLFFFHSLEWRPRESGNAVRQFRFPTALERSGDFSQTRDNNGNLYNLIKNPNSTAACSTTTTAGCYADGGVVGRIPASALYAPGLAILRQYPMPNLTQAPSTNYNYETLQPLEKRLNTQPSIRLDYQPAQALRLTVKYAGERQRKQIFKGTVPGFNDAAVPKPIITTVSTTINYTISPTTFIEGTYGMTQNELAGCVNLTTACTGAVPMSPISNKFTAGLGDLPVLFPGGLDMNPDYYEYKTLQDMGAPFFQDGRIELPPQFSWGSRINGNNNPPSPPNVNYPGWLNINRAQDLAISLTKVAGRHTFKAGYYNNHSYKAQHRGGGGPGSINFGQTSSNPLDTTFGFANAATGTFQSYTQLSRFVEGGWVYDNREGFIQDNWKVNSRLTLDYGLRFVHQDPQYDNHYQSANFLPELFNPAEAPEVYIWGCRNGVYPCSGNNRAAMNPITRQFLPQNVASIAVNTIVPNTGNPTNGLFATDKNSPLNQGYSTKGYTWPSVAFAPRVGFAYDLSGSQSFVVRGGGGLFYDRPEGNSVYGLISNPPFASSVTVNYGDLRQLGSGGLTFAGAPNLEAYEYNSDLPSSTQWNGGVQFSLPWSSALDVEYVGQHAFNTLIPNQGVNLNQFDLGVLFLPENQDRTQSGGVLGSQVLPTNAIRSYAGYGNIRQQWSRNWRTYHSLQTSYNRRFRDGISFAVNYTLGISDRQSTGTRLEHDPITGEVRVRADQKKADDLLGADGIRKHQLRANFVWDMPDLHADSLLMRGVGAVVNDWQLTGIYNFNSGGRYSVGYSYQDGTQNQYLTGSTDYTARVRIVGDPGSGCSSNQYQQFNTDVFQGPLVGSDGLESGANYLEGCPNNTWDMSVARNIRLGGGRNVQLRVDMFNAFNNVIFNGRQTNMQLNSQAGQTISNFQYDPATGQLVSTRLLPNQAGFGAVTGAQSLRVVTARASFSF